MCVRICISMLMCLYIYLCICPAHLSYLCVGVYKHVCIYMLICLYFILHMLCTGNVTGLLHPLAINLSLVLQLVIYCLPYYYRTF